MELSTWLKDIDVKKQNLLGINSFETFLKICNEFCEWALDDISLASRNNAYRIWTCRVPFNKLKSVKSVLESYTSMQLMLYYYNMNIIETDLLSFYIKLDYINNKWMMSYGLTNNLELFKVGEFEFNVAVKLPKSPVLKYIKDITENFDAREHLMLLNIKREFYRFNPGYCKIFEPAIIDKDIIVSTYNLGVWIDNNTLHPGEAQNYLDIFKNFVKQYKWASAVKLIVRPLKNKTIDFVIRLNN